MLRRGRIIQKGVGPYGTYDMAGNVREWTLTATESRRAVHSRRRLGRAELPLMPNRRRYRRSTALQPMVFGAWHDFSPNPPATLVQVRMLTRDFAHFIPATDAVFRAYQVLYQYDKTPLHEKVEGVVSQTANWRLEKVSYETAYRHERMAAYLYLPTHVRPPYQTVIFFPSARVEGLKDSENGANLGDIKFFDYVVQSGRAVLYPVYQNSVRAAGFSTRCPARRKESRSRRNRAKDVARSLDYLETRPDIDHTRFAYMGVSAGAAMGAIFATLAQDRLRTAIFLDGGFFLGQTAAGC